MSLRKKPLAPALSLKQSNNFGRLPSDAIVGMNRRDLPPSLRRGAAPAAAIAGQDGRSVPSYMTGTQTSQRRDIGMNVRRSVKGSSGQSGGPDPELLKGYGAPQRLPALYEQTGSPLGPRPGLAKQPVPAGETGADQPCTQTASAAPSYVPLQLGKSREVTAKEMQQISKSCRYVRRKGSLVDPPSFYYKR